MQRATSDQVDLAI